MNPKLLLLAAGLLLTSTGWANPESLREAISIRTEQGPSLCRLLALEREMASLIKESGQAPKEFLSRSADDPDPKVKRAMEVAREVEEIGRAQTTKTQRLRTLVGALTQEEKQEFQREHRAQFERC